MPFRPPGPTELIIILVIVMMIFGVGKLPQVGQTMGKAIREFRKSQKEDDDDDGENAVATEAVAEEKKEEASSGTG